MIGKVSLITLAIYVVIYLDRTEGISTTEIIDNIKKYL